MLRGGRGKGAIDNARTGQGQANGREERSSLRPGSWAQDAAGAAANLVSWLVFVWGLSGAAPQVTSDVITRAPRQAATADRPLRGSEGRDRAGR